MVPLSSLTTLLPMAWGVGEPSPLPIASSDGQSRVPLSLSLIVTILFLVNPSVSASSLTCLLVPF